jgi:predicted component of type VI protein secretion system
VEPVEPVQPAPQEPAPAQEQPAVDQPQPAPAEQPAPEQAPAQESAPTRPPRQRDLPAEQPAEETGGGSNFILDQAELIDTMVVSGARLWMCCGILFFLLIPVFMLIVYIRGRSKLRRQELGRF